MKRSFFALIVIALGLLAEAGYGQTAAPPQSKANTAFQFGNDRLDTLESRYFQSALNLTSTQTTAVLQAIAARNSLLRSLNAQPLSAPQRAGQLKPILSGFNNRLQQILTPGEQQQWALLSQNKLDSVISRCKTQHRLYSTLN